MIKTLIHLRLLLSRNRSVSLAEAEVFGRSLLGTPTIDHHTTTRTYLTIDI
jgi:hypothetical protein